jgi:uncharacterized protein YjbJ (UPF0337 family)
MSTTDPGDRSAAEIERDVERSRARLVGTAEELRNRVSPGQLAEQAMDWLRGSGGNEFLGNLGATLRDRPVPVLLVATGIAWLAMGGRAEEPRRRAAGWAPGRYPGESYPGESYPAQTYAAGRADGPSLTERASDTARETWSSVTGAAQSAAEGTADTARYAASRAGEALGSVRDSAGEALGSVQESARHAADYGRDMGRSLAETVEEQPLLLGALGLAFGAALGALFPVTEAEDRLMGDARDRVAGQVSALAGEARERLEEAGVSPRQGAAALGEVARDLRETVERKAEEVAGTARPGGSTPSGGAASTGIPPSRSGPEGTGPV